MLGFEHPSQILEGELESRFIRRCHGYVMIRHPLPIVYLLRTFQFRKRAVEVADPSSELPEIILIAVGFQILHTQHDHDARVLLRIIGSEVRYAEVVEPWISCISLVEIRIEHAEIQGFPESSGTGEEVDLLLLPEQFVDQCGFVHIVAVLFTDLLEVVNSGHDRSSVDAHPRRTYSPSFLHILRIWNL